MQCNCLDSFFWLTGLLLLSTCKLWQYSENVCSLGQWHSLVEHAHQVIVLNLQGQPEWSTVATLQTASAKKTGPRLVQVMIFHAPWCWLVCELCDLHCVLHLQPGFFCGSCAALQFACQKIIACRLLPVLCCAFGPVPARLCSLCDFQCGGNGMWASAGSTSVIRACHSGMF